MDMIFLVQGHCHLGVSKMDKDGNITDHQAAQFVSDEKGPCIAIGTMDADTMKQTGNVSIFGDYDAEGYLGHVLELLSPTTRQSNLPNIKAIVKNLENAGHDVCDFCPTDKCWNCAVRDWKD